MIKILIKIYHKILNLFFEFDIHLKNITCFKQGIHRYGAVKDSGMNVFPYEIERVACECGVENCVACETYENGKSGIVLVVEGEISEEKKEQILKSISLNLSHWHLPNVTRSCSRVSA